MHKFLFLFIIIIYSNVTMKVSSVQTIIVIYGTIANLILCVQMTYLDLDIGLSTSTPRPSETDHDIKSQGSLKSLNIDVSLLEKTLTFISDDLMATLNEFNEILASSACSGDNEQQHSSSTLEELVNSGSMNNNLDEATKNNLLDLVVIQRVYLEFHSETTKLLAIVTDSKNSMVVAEILLDKLSKLEDLSKSSALLTIIFDTLVIHLHTRCLYIVVGKLPDPPNIVKTIVELYVNGIDNPLLKSKDLSAAMVTLKYNVAHDFNLMKSITANGPLRRTLLTLIHLSPSIQDRIDDFIMSCNNYLNRMMVIWSPIELMTEEFDNDENNIKIFNNFILTQLHSYKYADICSQLSGSISENDDTTRSVSSSSSSSS